MPPSNPKQPPTKPADAAAGKAQDRAPRIGEVLADNYRLVREIGRGAMGAVYLAEDLALERQVAVKVLLPEHAVHPGQAALFRREARLLAAVRHENVVHVHTLGEHRTIPYMVMEYIVGPTLAYYLVQAVRVHDAIPLDLAISLALQLCRAVQVVHAAGIIHRDIKPWNFPLLDLPKFLRGEFRGNTAQLIPRFSRRVNKKIPDGTFGIGLQVRRIHWDFLAYRRYCALL